MLIVPPYMLFVSDVKKNKILEMTHDQKKLFGIDLLNTVTHVD